MCLPIVLRRQHLIKALQSKTELVTLTRIIYSYKERMTINLINITTKIEYAGNKFAY